MPSMHSRILGSFLVLAFTSISTSLFASQPPPSRWKFDSTVLSDYQRHLVNRCAQDQFSRDANPNYAVDGAHNMANIINRNEWSKPILSPTMNRLLEYERDDNGNFRPRGITYYPTYARDIRYPASRNNEQVSADYAAGRFPPWFPSDTYSDYVTPQQRAASPSSFTPNQVFMAQNTPDDVFLLTVCLPGCFAGATMVSTGEADRSIEELEDEDAASLLSLSARSTADRLAFEMTPVARWVRDIAPAEQPFVVVTTASGRHIEVTPEHPLLMSNGVPKRAHRLRVADEVLLEDGSADAIVHVNEVRRLARSFNVAMSTDERLPNFVSANGILAGTQRIQLEDDEVLAREVFRDSLHRSEFPSNS